MTSDSSSDLNQSFFRIVEVSLWIWLNNEVDWRVSLVIDTVRMLVMLLLAPNISLIICQIPLAPCSYLSKGWKSSWLNHVVNWGISLVSNHIRVQIMLLVGPDLALIVGQLIVSSHSHLSEGSCWSWWRKRRDKVVWWSISLVGNFIRVLIVLLLVPNVSSVIS